jgi:uncharacterized membrane protein YbaN (DUF454 family)
MLKLSTISFLMGSSEFYEWVNDNPMIEMHTVDYTNNPFIIAQNRKMIAINSALEVDLLGQVCKRDKESIGVTMYDPVTLIVKAGEVVDIQGGMATKKLRETLESLGDEKAFNYA